MNLSIELENPIREILTILQSRGEGYIVGGYVRDKLLGLTPEDCDFVTNLHYEILHELFKECSPKEFGKQFGIIQITYKGHTYEIARYRIDIGAPEDRKEQKVIFTESIREDLKRRDFTVNSIAFDGKNLIYNGDAIEDLEDGILKFNGDPNERIVEDPLRILRGIRFSATKNLFLDSEESYRKNMPLIQKLSTERIRDEFIKILLASNVKLGVELLMKLDAMAYLVPQFFYKFNSESLFDFEIFEKISSDPTHEKKREFFGILKTLQESPSNLTVRLGILLKDIKSSSSEIESILKNLKFERKIIETVSIILQNRILHYSKIDEKECRIILSKIGKENLKNFLEILKADLNYHFPKHCQDMFSDFKNCFEKIILENQPISKKDLKIDGTDLKALGYSGKTIGEILNRLLETVLENPELNVYEYLEDIVTKYENS